MPFTAIKTRATEPSTLSLDVWDWAKTRGDEAALLPRSHDELSVSPALVSLVVGESVTLSASHEPVDATVTSVVWSVVGRGRGDGECGWCRECGGCGGRDYYGC